MLHGDMTRKDVFLQYTTVINNFLNGFDCDIDWLDDVELVGVKFKRWSHYRFIRWFSV